MNKSMILLERGFQSSSRLTPEFQNFYQTFKKEFTRELQNIGAVDIVFNRGHFYVSGFFTVDNQPYYFSISDVRYFDNRSSHWGGLLYRTVRDYHDYTGGRNRYVTIEPGMSENMI